jgi:hypothetical protein
MRKIQRFFEDHVFRRSDERFIMWVSTFFIGFFSFMLFGLVLPTALHKKDKFWGSAVFALIALFAFCYVAYVLLMRKMITQYKAKHRNFDKRNWKNGWKGKVKVIAKWFDNRL